MPRTAAKRSQVANKRNPQRRSYGAPVLFRLPQVEGHSPAGNGTEAPETIAAELELETPALSISSVAKESMATVPESKEQEPSPVVSEASSLSEAPSPAPTPQPTALATPAPQSELSTEDDTSWWEHWSSGVVLVLLVIALVAATVIAFNDNSAADAELLAEGNTPSIEGVGGTVELDLGLDEITVPEVATAAKQSPVEDADVAEAIESLIPDLDLSTPSETETVAVSSPPEMDLPELALELEPPATQPNQDLSSEPQQTLEGMTVQSETPALEAPRQSPTDSAASSLLPMDLELGQATASLPPASAPASPATLDLPTEDRPQLFADSTTDTPGTQSPPYSVQSPENPSPYSTAQYPGNTESISTIAHSPTLAPELDSSSQPSNAMTNQESPLQPSTQSENGTRQTSTPEMDIDSLLKAYQFFRAQTNQ